MFSKYVNFGLFFIVLGIFGIAEGVRLIVRTGLAHGPGQYVAVLSVLLFLAGIYYYIEEMRNAGKNVQGLNSNDEAQENTETANLPEEYPKSVVPCLRFVLHVFGRTVTIGPEVIAFFLLLLYGLVNKALGYLTTTALFILLSMFLFGERSWWKLILVPILSGFFFWYVFISFARIPL
ncbi:MAG: hypothetical protein FWH49_01225 [Clostridiales bacterium]|nr:hypothetical protein [Clostridiales bacterium]